MVLKSIAPGLVCQSPAEVRQNNMGVLSAYSGSLRSSPRFGTAAIGAVDRVHIKRISPGMSDIDVVQGDPNRVGRSSCMSRLRDVDRQLVRIAKFAHVSDEVCNRELQESPPSRYDARRTAAAQGLDRCLVIVLQVPVIRRFFARGQGGR